VFQVLSQQKYFFDVYFAQTDELQLGVWHGVAIGYLYEKC